MPSKAKAKKKKAREQRRQKAQQQQQTRENEAEDVVTNGVCDEDEDDEDLDVAQQPKQAWKSDPEVQDYLRQRDNLVRHRTKRAERDNLDDEPPVTFRPSKFA